MNTICNFIISHSNASIQEAFDFMKTKLKGSCRRGMMDEQLTFSIYQARRILKTSRMERLEKRVKRAIEKTLTAPQVQKLDEVRC